LIVFDGQYFIPHEFISSFLVYLGGKSLSIEVEVVSTLLHYNIFLGRIWTYAMMIFISSVFLVLCFHHEGKIVVIEKVSFNYSDSVENLGSTVSLIENSHMETETINVGIYPSFMGTFHFSALVFYIHTTLVYY
jgi:hypothetical protein